MQLDVTKRRTDGPRAANLLRSGLASRTIPALASALVGGVVLAVYLTTLAPSVMWYDMGEFATASATLGIAHNTGYPLLILIGRVFTFLPVGDAAYRVNLMSAVFTAAAIAVVFGIIHDLTEDLIAAAIGALTLAFASTVWANATWATSYGLNLFFTALVTRCMLAWWRERTSEALIGAALAFGLGFCNHRLIVLVAPPSALLIALGWRSLTPRTAGLASLAFVAGLSVYLYLPIRGQQEPALDWARPANWHTYWSMFLSGQTPSEYWRFAWSDRIGVLWEYPSYDLTWAGIAMAALGLLWCARRQRGVAAYFVLLILLDAAVVETYSIHNIYNYLTPSYLAMCVLIGIAAAWMLDVIRSVAVAQQPVRPHLRVAMLAVLLALLPAALFAKNYDRVDRSGDYSALDFAQATLDRLPPRAVVMTDSWAASPLWYLQLVQGQRTDVGVSPIFSVTGDDPAAFARMQLDQGRPVYVAEGLRTPLDGLMAKFTVQPVLLDGIERMLVDTLPRPEYRDDLVATGSLYRVLDVPPVTVVDAVPRGGERLEAFDQGVTLMGYSSDGQIVQRSGVVQLTYYWRADRPLTDDLAAVTLFYDQQGRASAERGYAVWSQRRIIGQGVTQTSRWHAGDVIKESYFVLVPRTIAAGDYDVRIAVYDQHAADQLSNSAGLKTIGQITVR